MSQVMVACSPGRLQPLTQVALCQLHDQRDLCIKCVKYIGGTHRVLSGTQNLSMERMQFRQDNYGEKEDS
jgi:hypothetical protein